MFFEYPLVTNLNTQKRKRHENQLALLVVLPTQASTAESSTEIGRLEPEFTQEADVLTPSFCVAGLGGTFVVGFFF